VGDTVQTGQMIGLVGNSGNTSEPHIHIHLQSTPELFKIDDSGQIVALSDALGLPIYFSNYLANGELIEAGEPLGGQFVQNGS
jgi:murein DD-endopeptidase MepM/ murein hydrolase activator NlpD